LLVVVIIIAGIRIFGFLRSKAPQVQESMPAIEKTIPSE